ncbi:MAG: hypothetical protein B7X40_01170 [Cellulomonas sp. 14-74-6]|nr:MAG: hypothetical protein B7X40_01170 [Cellulomonas sp. 14-74-6]
MRVACSSTVVGDREAAVAGGRRRGGRRALPLFVASGLGAAGLITLVVLYLTVWTATLQASAAGTSPCLDAYTSRRPGAHVQYAVAPPAALCWWQPDGAGSTQRVEVATTDARLFWAGAVVGVGGLAVALWRGVPVLRRL